MRTPVRYCLLQLPGLTLLFLLLTWLVIGGWITTLAATGIVAIWLLKDAAMYPLARHVLEMPPPASGTAALIGRETCVSRALEPHGLVRIGSERWLARSRDHEHVPAGHRVRVVGADGLELVVERVCRAGGSS